MQGFSVERKKVTPAVGIKFIIEEKIFNLSGSYLRRIFLHKFIIF